MDFHRPIFLPGKKGTIIDNGNSFKDFISINSIKLYILLLKDIFGIYNISIGKKIYLNKIIEWLNYYNKNKCKIVKLKMNLSNKDNFTLNNEKLMKIISFFKYSINDLEKYCKYINIFISKIKYEKKI